MKTRVYLDHHAATPVDPRVRAALAALDEAVWANPSSVHAEGRRSRQSLEAAREQVGRAIAAQPADVVLTSGGTEACNLAIAGVLRGEPGPCHVVTSPIEHPAVAEPIAELEQHGAIQVTRLAVSPSEPPAPEALRAALRSDTRLCALQWVNHETGSIFPIAAYAEICRAAGVPLFVDATQGFGKLPLSVLDMNADLVALASHKIGGTAGAGALWVRRGLSLHSVLLGGGQERGRRAGTPDVRSAIAFGIASTLVPERLAAQPRIAALRDQLEAELSALGAEPNAAQGTRVATVTNVWWPGRRADALVAALDIEGLAISAGAACSSGKSEPSPVLRAFYPADPAKAQESIRFSFGSETDENMCKIAVDYCRVVLSRRTG